MSRITAETEREQQESHAIREENKIFHETYKAVKEAVGKDPLREARLWIQQEDIIQLTGWRFKQKAKNWLELPSGWSDMKFTIEDLGHREGYKIEAVNLGANAGVTFRRSGFIIAANWYTGISRTGVQVVYLPEDNQFREPLFDMQNPYWQRQHNFMEEVNRRGREFSDELSQKPRIDQLTLASNLIDRATRKARF